MAERSLRRKGFRLETRRHRVYHFYHAGKKPPIFRLISHGQREIPEGLLGRMRLQLRLATNQQVRDLLECPIEHADYLRILRDRGVDPLDP
ncbi:MAG: hypothetical protein ACE5JM_10710 [Armatimonadota bacterium]